MPSIRLLSDSTMAAQLRFWNDMPVLEPDDDLRHVTELLCDCFEEDFCISLCFDAPFLARLMREGYITMAERIGPDRYILLPKLHKERCVLHFQDLHVQRAARKCSSRFHLTIDQCFPEVLRQCVLQHGENWLYPPLQQIFSLVNSRREGLEGVRMHSVELWEGDTLVAGELGSAVGGVYTSLSGFKKVSCSGTVQCVATALVLWKLGFAFWDLGMELDYKLAMGARSIPRRQFITELKRAASLPAVLQYPKTCARDILHLTAELRPYVPQRPNPKSKRQQKKQAKRQRRLEAKAKKKVQRQAENTVADPKRGKE